MEYLIFGEENTGLGLCHVREWGHAVNYRHQTRHPTTASMRIIQENLLEVIFSLTMGNDVLCNSNSFDTRFYLLKYSFRGYQAPFQLVMFRIAEISSCVQELFMLQSKPWKYFTNGIGFRYLAQLQNYEMIGQTRRYIMGNSVNFSVRMNSQVERYSKQCVVSNVYHLSKRRCCRYWKFFLFVEKSLFILPSQYRYFLLLVFALTDMV